MNKVQLRALAERAFWESYVTNEKKEYFKGMFGNAELGERVSAEIRESYLEAYQAGFAYAHAQMDKKASEAKLEAIQKDAEKYRLQYLADEQKRALKEPPTDATEKKPRSVEKAFRDLVLTLYENRVINTTEVMQLLNMGSISVFDETYSAWLAWKKKRGT